MKKRTVLLLALLCIIMTAAACGREKDPGKPGSGDVTKEAEENQPGETPTSAENPTPTVTVIPTPTPTPTPEALPEGFPASASLEITPKYKRDEVIKLMEQEVKEKASYVYHEVTQYEEAKQFWSIWYGIGYADITADRFECLYSTPQESDRETIQPDAQVYSLNGENVLAEYQTSYGTYFEFEGKSYASIRFTEKSSDGKDNYTYSEYSIEHSAYDENGRLCLTETYSVGGKLNSVTEYIYNENGRVTQERRFVREAGSTEWKEKERHVYTYGANGNRKHHSAKVPENETSLSYEEEYSYRTDQDGRLQSILVKRSGEYKRVLEIPETETRYFYMKDKSVLKVVRGIKGSYDGDGNEIPRYDGELFYPTKLQTEYLQNGLDPDAIENDEEQPDYVKYGNMNKVASDGTASDYAFDKETTWEEATYKNGRLVHFVSRNYSGYECFYEYNSAGKCTHQYGHEGYYGKFDSRYSYDSAGRLIKEENKGTTESSFGTPFIFTGDDEYSGEQSVVSVIQYKYDKNGNRISMEKKVTKKGTVYGTVTESYDEDGYLVSSETKSYRPNDKWVCVGERIR